MYNETIRFIYQRKFDSGRYLTTWKRIRDHNLNVIKKEITDKIFVEYETTVGKRNPRQIKNIVHVPSHVLDHAIKDACSKFKAALTNIEDGNISHFRIRYMKKSKKDKILGLEKINFSKIGFFPRFLGKMNLYCQNNAKINEDAKITESTKIKDNAKSKKKEKSKNVNYKDIIKGDPTLHYDYSLDRFTLLVPETVETKATNNPGQKDTYIGLDAGIRTFLTGLSNKDIIEIGMNMAKVLSIDFRKLDKINKNDKIPKKIKKKYELRINKRMKNRITDMHWKVIKYLTDNYDNIILGKLSTKSIVSKKGNLHRMTKRIAMKMSFYEFVMKLKYKCERKKINFQYVSEAYTSKFCSGCGAYNDVGRSKYYKCEECGRELDRDVNAAKNIAMRGLRDYRNQETLIKQR